MVASLAAGAAAGAVACGYAAQGAASDTSSSRVGKGCFAGFGDMRVTHPGFEPQEPIRAGGTVPHRRNAAKISDSLRKRQLRCTFVVNSQQLSNITSNERAGVRVKLRVP